MLSVATKRVAGGRKRSVRKFHCESSESEACSLKKKGVPFWRQTTIWESKGGLETIEIKGALG